jgi:mRNA interferase MazF
MNPRPAEIWLADLGLAAKTRPVVIVSRQDADAPQALAIYVPLTTQNRNSPYEVALPKLGFLNAGSVANVQGIASIPAIRLERKLGTSAQGPWPKRASVSAVAYVSLNSTGILRCHQLWQNPNASVVIPHDVQVLIRNLI